jgi:hypothetical protein
VIPSDQPEFNRAGSGADTLLVLAVDTASTAYQIGEFVGLAFVLVLAFVVLRRATTSGFGARPGGALNVSLGTAAVLIAAGCSAHGVKDGMFEAGASAGSTQSAWSTREGVNLKAGFIAGCSHNLEARDAVCECVFERVASTPPYNTPEGFEVNLAPAIRRAQAAGQPKRLPVVLVSAARKCAPATGV